MKGLQEAFERLQLYSRGISAAAQDEATTQILQKHLIKGLGMEAVDTLLQYQDVRRAST